MLNHLFGLAVPEGRAYFKQYLQLHKTCVIDE